MPADDFSSQPVRLRLPHLAIVRAPGLLPMLYRPNELAKELDMSPMTIADWAKKGLPHQRDGRGHLWINGQELAGWIAQVRQSRASRPRCGWVQTKAFAFAAGKSWRSLIPPLRSAASACCIAASARSAAER